MTNDERLRMNVQTVRVTLASALRHASGAQADACVTRARHLLAGVRARATSPSVLSEIDALEVELEAYRPTASQEEG